jgi:hypothetical protein
MQKDYFKYSHINTEDPDNLHEFALASVVSGSLVAEEVAPGIHVISNALDKMNLSI